MVVGTVAKDGEVGTCMVNSCSCIYMYDIRHRYSDVEIQDGRGNASHGHKPETKEKFIGSEGVIYEQDGV